MGPGGIAGNQRGKATTSDSQESVEVGIGGKRIGGNINIAISSRLSPGRCRNFNTVGGISIGVQGLQQLDNIGRDGDIIGGQIQRCQTTTPGGGTERNSTNGERNGFTSPIIIIAAGIGGSWLGGRTVGNTIDGTIFKDTGKVNGYIKFIGHRKPTTVGCGQQDDDIFHGIRPSGGKGSAGSIKG